MPNWCSCGNPDCPSHANVCGTTPECNECHDTMDHHVCWTTVQALEKEFKVPEVNARKYTIQYLYDRGEDEWEQATYLPPSYLYASTWEEALQKLNVANARGEGYELRIVYFATGIPINRMPDDEYPPGLEKKNMVLIKYLREGGKLMVSINAQGLHEILDSIGVQTEGDPARYKDRPYSVEAVANTSSMILSTETLLVKQYPAKFDLSVVFIKPPSLDSLKKLAQSGYEQCRKILEHYQPIDIQVEIQKKVLKEVM